jgi:hypothetical protein
MLVGRLRTAPRRQRLEGRRRTARLRRSRPQLLSHTGDDRGRKGSPGDGRIGDPLPPIGDLTGDDRGWKAPPRDIGSPTSDDHDWKGPFGDMLSDGDPLPPIGDPRSRKSTPAPRSERRYLWL